MIKKLKRRYLITNMALLSSTLIVCLAVLFGFLYHSQIASSYAVMQEMMKQSEIPGYKKPALRPPAAEPQAYTYSSVESKAMQLNFDPNAQDGGQQPWAEFDPSRMPNPWEQPWMYPWTNPWAQPWQDPNRNQEQREDPNAQGSQQQAYPNNEDRKSYEEQKRLDDDKKDGDDRIDKRGDDRNQEQGAQHPAATAPPPQFESRQTVTGVTRPDEGGRFQREPAETNPVPPRQESTSTAETQSSTEVLNTETTSPPAAFGQINTENRIEPPQIVPVHEGEYVPNAFMAQIDGDGNIEAYAGSDSAAEEDGGFRTIHHAFDEVNHSGREAGTVEIGDNSYRYLYQPDGSGSYRLVLLDRTLELSTLSKLLFIFVLITAVGLLIMFGISVLLANWTVTPVAAAWEKQKQFVADASHELKTPLAVISANTEVILANPAESVAGQSKWLGYIQSETMRMSKLISNLLSVARMDSKEERREQIALLQLSEAVSNVCLVFEPIVFENGKTLNTVIQRNLTLRAEEDNIKQLLSILLDNAVLHSVPKAQITVSLSKDAQNKIRLSVANTAKDIPPEQLSHLFDRFYRADTEGSPNGSGLGLSIAKSIVHELGGTISVSSENQLVTFTALLHS
ncbi:MAG: HAMP domain-containing histidine kinase [Oscillospiraceae bacterium]|nr:HAMP domain-containing histidine kinase [Oscillospiraceae bacterium]